MTKRCLFLAALTPLLTSCVPWTVRPIGKTDASSESGPSVSDPAAYVESLWASKLVPSIVGSATSARVLLDAIAASPDGAGEKYGRRESGGAWQFRVKGEGHAIELDTHSRNGLLLLDLAPYDGRADVSIQIGPVLRGTALRDATGLIRFTDFVNQIQFADVANELNKRVLAKVLAPVGLSAAKGKTVSFAGAFTLEGAGEPLIRGVVPVSLAVEGTP